MFWKSKRKTLPKTRSAPEPSGVYEKPAFNEEKTQTLEILLGDTDLSLDEDSEQGGDPHDNTGKHSVAHLRSKLE